MVETDYKKRYLSVSLDFYFSFHKNDSVQDSIEFVITLCDYSGPAHHVYHMPDNCRNNECLHSGENMDLSVS